MDQVLPNFASTAISDNQASQRPLEHKTLHELPRTVLRSNNYLLLDGEWNFAYDQDDRGLRDGWHLHHDFLHKAKWPGSVEEHIHEAQNQEGKAPWRDKVVVWYERTFDIPPRPEEFSHLMYQLTFGACGYETRVWLNGNPLKTIEGEEVHYGEYTSFSYELTDALLLPSNRLTVRIEDTMDSDLTRGKQESHVYKRGGIWYQTYTGAVRSIWLEAVERNRLRSRIGVVSLVEDQLVRFNFTTRIHDPGQYLLKLHVYPFNERQEPIATTEFTLLLEAGQKNQRVVMELPGAELWSPERPNLYWIVAELIDHNGYSASIQAHFGLRKIEARGRYIYLNNKSIYLDGILYQPGTATYEEMRNHMIGMKKLGCNLVRVHIAGIDPRIYNLADEIGMLLWVEVPSPHSSTHQSRKNHWEELQRMLSLIEANPSIVMWSLYNEDWGVQDITTNAKTRQYIIDTYHYMQIHHPQFLVIDNDGWHHISLEGRLKSDLLTAHVYTPDLDRWRETLHKLASGDLNNVGVFPLVVGDPFFYRGQVPLVVSEWGGFGFADYGGPAENGDRAERIRAFKEELRRHRIAGDIYTQATNIEDEKNGLIDFHTGELWVPEGLLRSTGNGNGD